MKISGSYQFNAPPQKVWDTLMNPKTLSDCIPGCDGLNSTGPDQYQAVVNIGVGPVRGRYNAKIALLDQQPPVSSTALPQLTSPRTEERPACRLTATPR